jgi:HIP---CoA ligase
MTTAQFASLADLVDKAAERFGERTAIVDGDTRQTYQELVAASREFGAALVASGVQPQDRVAIWAPNSREWVTAVLGIFQAGATLVPVNTRYKGVEAADMLRRAGVKVLVTATEFLGTDYVTMLREAAPDLPDLQDVVVTHGPVAEATVGWDDFLARAGDGDLEEVTKRSAALGPDDPSDILFTSGTTGVPKGVVMTHGRTLRVATDWVAMTGLEAGDVYLMVNPYFHMFGLKAGILASVTAGATMLPEPVFDIDRALQRVQEEGVTVFPRSTRRSSTIPGATSTTSPRCGSR